MDTKTIWMAAAMFFALVAMAVVGCEPTSLKTPAPVQTLPEEIDPPPITVKDRPPVTVKLEVTEKRAETTGYSGNISVIVTPHVDVASLLLSISVAGEAVAVPPNGFRETDTPPPYIKGLNASSHLERRLENLKAERSLSFDVPVKIAALGRAYVLANVNPGTKLGTLGNNHSAVVFLLATGKEMLFGHHSFLDLEAQKLTSDLTTQGANKEEIAKKVKRLRRSGAIVEKKLISEQSGHAPSVPESPYNSVTVRGRVLFAAINDTTHPVRFVDVQIWDEEEGPDDELVATTTTDADGNYEAIVDDNDGDGTGRDIYVIVRAEGDTVRLADYASLGGPSVVWEIDSLPAMLDVVDESTLEINLTATNDDSSPNNVAFEVYESLNFLSRYLSVLGEPIPPRVSVLLPCPSYSSLLGDSTILLEGTDVHEWDTIHHEYGHYVQHLYGIANNPGVVHSPTMDLCSAHGKDEGIRAAWAEGWATFFAIMAQQEMELAALSIPEVGDTIAGSTTAFRPYDLEVYDALYSHGEGNEGSIHGVLWDLYDEVNDAGDRDVSLGARELWDLVTDNRPHNFSEFWNALILGRTADEIAAFGAILAQYTVAPALTEPADGLAYTGGPVPALQWTGNMTCDPGDNASFSVRFYNQSMTSLIWASPWQASTTFNPTDSQRDLIFSGPSGTLRYLVAARGESTPESGVYYGDSRTLIDNFDVPERSPVDIILALDLSDSMSSLVPGDDSSLSKLELLKQAVEIFIRTWTMHAIDGDRIGVLYFSDDVDSASETDPVLMSMTDPDDVDAIVDDVKGKSSLDCTAIGGALQVAYDSFEVASPNKRVVILFTDGAQTSNPFIDEEGFPSRLKIRVIPWGGTLPFDAGWCSPVTARAPDESIIAPDSQFVDEHNVGVHTVGVGVDGDSFEQLINRISSETGGVHLFTSSPDEDLDIFYTNDLVNSLKTATLELVKTAHGTLSTKDQKVLSFPINETAKALTLVLSWRGEEEKDLLAMQVMTPDGSPVSPSRISQGDFYTVVNIDLPLGADEGDIRHAGNWKVEFRSQARDIPVKYQFSAIVDEPCFNYRFQLSRKEYGTGERILLTTTLTHNGKPLAGMDGIQVHVTGPAWSAGNLLSHWLPHLGHKGIADHKQKEGKGDEGKQSPAEIVASHGGSEFAARSKAKADSTVRLYDDGSKKHGDRKAGDGIYSSYFAGTQIPGNYRFRLDILTPSACGKVARTEVISTLVRIKDFDPKLSLLQVKPVTETAKEAVFDIEFTPADKYGNLLGPGKGEEIGFFVSSGTLGEKVTDNLDGSYNQRLEVNKNDNPRITVNVDGRTLIEAPLFLLAPKDAGGGKE